MATQPGVKERKTEEPAACDRDQTLRQVAGHLSEAFWTEDAGTRRTLYVNPAYERIWGRSCESLYDDSRSFIDAIHARDRLQFRDAHEEQIRSQAPLDTHFRVIRPVGSTRWIHYRSFADRDAGGKGYRFVRIAEDLTESRGEADQAESERLGNLGTWAIDLSNREIVFWSEQHYRIFGFEPGLGPPSLDAALARFHPEDRDVLENVKQALTERKSFELQFRVVHPDGSVRYIRSLGHPVFNASCETVEFAGVAIDVTDRRLAEEALRHSVEQYRALAAQAEFVREEERVRLARQIHDEMGGLLTGAVMDLRCLIQRPPARREERAKRLEAIVRLIGEAIQSAQNIAAELRPRVLDDLGLVAAVEWSAGEFASRAGMKCSLELPREELAIEPNTDTALFRILQEALTNIARHAEATEFSVRLVLQPDELCLTVADNGKGFDEGRLASRGSLGILGMRERALMIDGHLTIESSPGKGTRVTVRAPAPARDRWESG